MHSSDFKRNRDIELECVTKIIAPPTTIQAIHFARVLMPVAIEYRSGFQSFFFRFRISHFQQNQRMAAMADAAGQNCVEIR